MAAELNTTVGAETASVERRDDSGRPGFGARTFSAPQAGLGTTGQPAAEPHRTISGGFEGVAEDLDRRSRDWTMMVRLLEQQRLHLETAEKERNRLHAALEGVMPQVRGTSYSLQVTLDMTKSGHTSDNIAALFDDNLRTLDELENTAKALTSNLLWTRASWEQYARSVISGEKLREDLKA